MALTTLANVKEYIQIPSDEIEQDTVISRLISVAESFVENYCKRQLEAQDYTEYYSTKSGQTKLLLDQYPVNSITNIYDDPDRSYSAGTLIDTQYYVVETRSGIIYFDGITVHKGRNNMKVEYNAGYSTIPADLEQAVLELVAQKYHGYDKIRQGIQSRSFEGESVQFFLKELYPETKAVLDKYKKVR